MKWKPWTKWFCWPLSLNLKFGGKHGVYAIIIQDHSTMISNSKGPVTWPPCQKLQVLSPPMGSHPSSTRPGQASTHTPGYFPAFSPFATKGITFGWLVCNLGLIANGNWMGGQVWSCMYAQNGQFLNVIQIGWKFVSRCAWLRASRIYQIYPIWISSCGENGKILSKYRFFLMNPGYMHYLPWLYAPLWHICLPTDECSNPYLL